MTVAELETLAKKAAGNWRKFDSFGWHERPDNAEQWCIVYTHNRDSTLLDQANAKVIAEEMKPFTTSRYPTARAETHSHWACGWVEGYSIRVYNKAGKITKAFEKWCDLKEQMDHYPVLDDAEYSRLEMEATLKNLPDAAWRLRGEYELPDDWVHQVYYWLGVNDDRALENVDDKGAWPSEESLRAAFDALGYPKSN